MPSQNSYDELRQVLAQSLPNHWEDLRLTTPAPLASDGWESDLFSCAVEYTEARARHRRDLVIKVYLGELASEKARNEFTGMKRLHASDYPVPEVFAFDPGDPPHAKPFVAMERVDGQRLSEALQVAPTETQTTLLSRFCELLVRLHSLDWRPFVPNPEEHTPEGFVPRWIETAEGVVRRHGRHEFDPVLPSLRERSRQVVSERLSVVHWDYHPSNLLLKPDDSLVVIDWSGLQAADYRFDLGWTLMLSGAYAGPGARDFILHEYERIAGAPVKDVDFFEAVAAVNRLFDVSVTLAAGAERLGMRPEAAAEIRKNASTLNYVYALLQANTSVSLPQVEALIASLQEG